MAFNKYNPAANYSQGFDSDVDLAGKYAGALTAPQSMTEGQFMGGLFPGLLESIRQNQYNNSPEGMAKLLELGRQDASAKAKEQFKWSTLAKFPSAIATAFGGGPDAQEIFRQTAASLPVNYANTLAAFPQIQVPGSSTQQYRYF
jgi:hypothetical protein